jgi:hypothetical protein
MGEPMYRHQCKKLAFELGAKTLILLLFAAATPRLLTAGDLVALALSDWPAPVLGEPAIYGPIGHPLINDRGDVTFVGLAADKAVRWKIASDGTTLPVVISGQIAPGNPAGMTFNPLNYPLQLDNDGKAAFFADVRLTTGSNEVGVWAQRASVLQHFALTDAPMPGVSSRYVPWRFTELLHGTAGHLAVSAVMDDKSTSALTSKPAIWSGLDSLQLVATTDQPAPGMPSGTRFVNVNSARAINGHGTLAFTATVSGPGTTGDTNTAFWLADTNGPQSVVREGDIAPDSNDARFGDIFTLDVSINDADQFVFQADLAGPLVSEANAPAVYAGDHLTLRKVARRGDTTPVAGLNFDDWMSRTVINAQGKVAFFSNVTDGTTKSGAIWSEGLEGLHIVAKESDQAPGLPDGQSFGALLAGGSQHVINAAGQVAFIAGYGGQGFGTGIWAEDRAGKLHLIAHQGQTIEVAPGDFRTIDQLVFLGDSGSQDGRPRGFNDRGQIVFSARVAGGWGVFLSNKVAIPEPGTGILMFIAVTALSSCLRRHM